MTGKIPLLEILRDKIKKAKRLWAALKYIINPRVFEEGEYLSTVELRPGVLHNQDRNFD